MDTTDAFISTIEAQALAEPSVQITTEISPAVEALFCRWSCSKTGKQIRESREACQKHGQKVAHSDLSIHATKKTEDPLGMTIRRRDDFSAWYLEVVRKGEMIGYYNGISGSFMLRPRSIFIWNIIPDWFTDKIPTIDVQEASFPIVPSEASLKKEKDHIEGFAPELAWVTKA